MILQLSSHALPIVDCVIKKKKKHPGNLASPISQGHLLPIEAHFDKLPSESLSKYLVSMQNCCFKTKTAHFLFNTGPWDLEWVLGCHVGNSLIHKFKDRSHFWQDTWCLRCNKNLLKRRKTATEGRMNGARLGFTHGVLNSGAAQRKRITCVCRRKSTK